MSTPAAGPVRTRKKDLVITASDARCGGFLVRHWLSSLERVIDRSRVDVAGVDYGLTPAQRALLGSRNVILWQGGRDGHVTSLRLRDIAAFLSGHPYDQVMVADGGDLIFQDAFMDMFARSPDRIRGVLRGRTPINTGLLIGPAAVLERCFSEAFCMIQDRSKWGPDMVALNYILHRDGFVSIEETYNCVITTARSGFRIRQGRFYFPDGSLIKIVHNAGYKSFFRIIGRFGLGSSFRIGSPKETTALTTNGIFALSRNPMYVGVYATLCAAVLHTLNPILLLVAAYVIVVHHKIVLAEEAHLRDVFGQEYRTYSSRVRRYL